MHATNHVSEAHSSLGKRSIAQNILFSYPRNVRSDPILAASIPSFLRGRANRNENRA